MDSRARAAGDSSDDGSSSSSSDSVLIPMLDQRHRQKLQAQMQLEQQKQRKQQQQQQQQQKQQQQQQQQAAVAGGRLKREKKRKKADGDDEPPRSQPKKERRSGAPKNEHICVVCERGDSGTLVMCAGPCVSAFHIACLPADEQPAALDSLEADAKPWLCEYCRSQRHECFHCKEIGAEQASDDGTASGTSGDSSAAAKGPVRKCRALSCGKYYHLDCITKFPLARIAGTHFICPLHTCASCVKSGAQKEAVRCVRCPVAYHASCLPAEGVRQLTPKLIVCPSHTEEPLSVAVKKTESKDRELTSTDLLERTSSVEVIKKESVHATASDKDENCGHSNKRVDEIVKEDGAESEGSERSAMSSASANEKKLHKSKKEKRDKKKKRRKKKKLKRKESRGRLASSSQDEESTAASGEEGDRASRKTGSSSRRGSFEEEGGSGAELTAVTVADKAVKRESSEDGDVSVQQGMAVLSSRSSFDEAASVPLAIDPSKQGGDSPSLRASLLFESPATTKQRLVDALGQSDEDEDESAKSPVAPASMATAESRASIVQASIVEADEEEKTNSRIDDSAQPPRTDDGSISSDSKLEHISHDRPSISPPPSERSEQVPVFDIVGSSVSIPPSTTIASNSSIGRLLNPPDTPTIKQEETSTGAVESPKVEQLAVKIPKSASSSSLTSAVKAGRSAKGSVSEGEEGDDEGPGSATTPRSRRLARIKAEQSTVVTPRGSTKSNAKKKAKKGRPSKATAESDNDTAGGDTLVVATDEGAVGEVGWVQCDNCKKWRTVPQSIDLASMPERWYCHMNAWNQAFASCDVAEEDIKQRTPQKPPPHALEPDRSKKKSRKKKPSAGAANGGTGSDGGSSSSSSGAGVSGNPGVETSSAAAASAPAVEADASDALAQLTAKQIKKQEKQEKRKKRKLGKTKDKYRELKWVQCDSAQCGKWRVVPSSIEVELLPTRWYCHLNTWSPELAKCSAPNPPEVEAFLRKQAAKDALLAAGSRSQSNKRPKPGPSASGDGVLMDTQASGASSGDTPGAIGVATGGYEPGHKPAKASKSAKTSTQMSQGQQVSSSSGHPQIGSKMDLSIPSGSSAGATVLSAVAVATGTTPHGIDTKTGAFQSGKASSKSTNTGASSTGGQVKRTVLEWAQCEKCNKWRKLPSHIKSSTLPDKWYCSMNHWDPARAKCSIPEEVEPEPLAVGPIPGTPGWYHGSVGSTKTGGSGGSRPRRGKLSYSDLLFASTGHLRKTYTPESSTLSFEYEGVTYRRDDMYRDSSLYMPPEEMEKAIKDAATAEASTVTDVSMSIPASPGFPAAWLGLALATSTSDPRTRESDKGTTVGISAVLFASADHLKQESAAIERIASAVLAAMDLRRDWSVSELFEKLSGGRHDGIGDSSEPMAGANVSLPLLAAALGELECKGLIERLNEEHARSSKRRKTEAQEDEPSTVGSDSVLLYRKVPSRPLKATKWWRSARSASNGASTLPVAAK